MRCGAGVRSAEKGGWEGGGGGGWSSWPNHRPLTFSAAPVVSPSSPTYEVDSSTSNVSSPTLFEKGRNCIHKLPQE